VPHINPKSVGIVSGVTGAFGNLGGILFSLVFRYSIKDGKSEYMRGFWIIGVVSVGIAVVCAFIPVREDRPDNYVEKTDEEQTA
jgi:NNP family nitrate/nitrite transporter-like MFS transporter